MFARIPKTAMAALVLGVPCSAAAQTFVSFDVPLNLTQVSPDIEKVRITCQFGGSDGLVIVDKYLYTEADKFAAGLWRQQEFPVMAGQVVINARMVFPIGADLLPANPVGKEVKYDCVLMGFSKSLKVWNSFNETHAVAAFRLKPTPEQIIGSFVW